VDAPAFAALREHIADFGRENEPGGRVALLEFIEPGAVVGQPEPELGEVVRVREVARAQQVDAFNRGPAVERFHIHLLAGGPAVLGVDVEIRYKLHIRFPGKRIARQRRIRPAEAGRKRLS